MLRADEVRTRPRSACLKPQAPTRLFLSCSTWGTPAHPWHVDRLSPFDPTWLSRLWPLVQVLHLVAGWRAHVQDTLTIPIHPIHKTFLPKGSGQTLTSQRVVHLCGIKITVCQPHPQCPASAAAPNRTLRRRGPGRRRPRGSSCVRPGFSALDVRYLIEISNRSSHADVLLMRNRRCEEVPWPDWNHPERKEPQAYEKSTHLRHQNSFFSTFLPLGS